MKKKVFLADLTHTGRGIHASTFPLGMSFVASYAKEHLGEDYEIKVFKFPDHLSAAIIEQSPDFLCFSNYSWNLELGYKISSLAKEINPKLIVISGGPNFPVLPSERRDFLKRRPVIDFYFQNEGEIGFVELIQKLQENNFDIAALKQKAEPITKCVYLWSEELIEGPFKRILDPNIIPSPYLSGILDAFFDHPLTPMIETTRGCPFSCAFCADGIITKSRIARFDRERTREELDYIVKRIKNVDELILTDLNFGMYKEDIPIAEYIAEVQKKYNWPIVIGASTGKNNKEQVLKAITILGGSLVTGAAIQSSDPQVLKNIKRSNISLEAYRGFLDFANSFSKDAVAFTEIILALPGDSKETHFNSLRYGIDNGAKILRMYQAMLLSGTAMASGDMRQEFQYLTKFRVIPGGVGIYNFNDKSYPIAEVEEIIVGSKDMPFEDYIACRKMNLIIESFFNNGLFSEFFSVLKIMNVSAFDCLLYIFAHPELYTHKMKEILANFVDATSGDLYNTYDEAMEYTSRPEVLQKFISGELGINELLVHRAELYLELDDISQVLLASATNFLREKGLLNNWAKKYLEELIKFNTLRKKSFYKYEDTLEGEFSYDFKRLEESNFEIDPRTLPPGANWSSFKFYHDNSQKSHIQNAMNLYLNTPSGIGRLIQRSNLKKMYRNFDYTHAILDVNMASSGEKITYDEKSVC